MSKFGVYEISVYGFDNDDDFRFNDTARIKITHMLTSGTDTNSAEPLIRAYPNPFNERVNIFIHSAISEEVTISIESISGSTVYSGNATLFTGDNTVIVSPGSLSPGIYVVSIRGDATRQRIKIIKQ
jgi:hypothetical protein